MANLGDATAPWRQPVSARIAYDDQDDDDDPDALERELQRQLDELSDEELPEDDSALPRALAELVKADDASKAVALAPDVILTAEQALRGTEEVVQVAFQPGTAWQEFVADVEATRTELGAVISAWGGPAPKPPAALTTVTAVEPASAPAPAPASAPASAPEDNDTWAVPVTRVHAPLDEEAQAIVNKLAQEVNMPTHTPRMTHGVGFASSVQLEPSVQLWHDTRMTKEAAAKSSMLRMLAMDDLRVRQMHDAENAIQRKAEQQQTELQFQAQLVEQQLDDQTRAITEAAEQARQQAELLRLQHEAEQARQQQELEALREQWAAAEALMHAERQRRIVEAEQRRLGKAAALIQALVKSRTDRAEYAKTRQAALAIQTRWRGFICRKKVQQLRKKREQQKVQDLLRQEARRKALEAAKAEEARRRQEAEATRLTRAALIKEQRAAAAESVNMSKEDLLARAMRQAEQEERKRQHAALMQMKQEDARSRAAAAWFQELERRRLATEAAALARAQAEAARRRADEEVARLRAEEDARRQAEQEATRKRAEEEAARKRAADEEASRRKAEEAARLRLEEEAAHQRAQEAARRLAEEEARRKAQQAAFHAASDTTPAPISLDAPFVANPAPAAEPPAALVVSSPESDKHLAVLRGFRLKWLAYAKAAGWSFAEIPIPSAMRTSGSLRALGPAMLPTPAAVEDLCMALNLESLDTEAFIDASVENMTDLTPFLACRHLKILHANSNKLTSVQPLAALSDTLTDLSIKDNAVTSLAGIGRLAKLQSLCANVNRLNCLSDLVDEGALLELRTLQLDYNVISSLHGLEALPAIERLDLCHNRLTQLPLDQFRHQPFLQRLDVSRNQLTKLEGLSCCPLLLWLCAGQNRLQQFPALQLPLLQNLWLNGNQLTSFCSQPEAAPEPVFGNNAPSFKPDPTHIWLPSLQSLQVADNLLVSLSGVHRFPNLTHLDASFNNIKSLAEFQHLRHLKCLRSVAFHDNPVAAQPAYRLELVKQVPSLETIDDVSVTDAERRLVNVSLTPSTLEMALLLKQYIKTHRATKRRRAAAAASAASKLIPTVHNFVGGYADYCSSILDARPSTSDASAVSADVERWQWDELVYSWLCCAQRWRLARMMVDHKRRLTAAFDKVKASGGSARQAFVEQYCALRNKLAKDLRSSLVAMHSEHVLFGDAPVVDSDDALAHLENAFSASAQAAASKIQRVWRRSRRPRRASRAEKRTAPVHAARGPPTPTMLQAAIAVQALWRGHRTRTAMHRALERARYTDHDDFDYAAVDIDSMMAEFERAGDDMESMESMLQKALQSLPADIRARVLDPATSIDMDGGALLDAPQSFHRSPAVEPLPTPLPAPALAAAPPTAPYGYGYSMEQPMHHRPLVMESMYGQPHQYAVPPSYGYSSMQYGVPMSTDMHIMSGYTYAQPPHMWHPSMPQQDGVPAPPMSMNFMGGYAGMPMAPPAPAGPLPMPLLGKPPSLSLSNSSADLSRLMPVGPGAWPAGGRSVLPPSPNTGRSSEWELTSVRTSSTFRDDTELDDVMSVGGSSDVSSVRPPSSGGRHGYKDMVKHAQRAAAQTTVTSASSATNVRSPPRHGRSVVSKDRAGYGRKQKKKPLPGWYVGAMEGKLDDEDEHVAAVARPPPVATQSSQRQAAPEPMMGSSHRRLKLAHSPVDVSRPPDHAQAWPSPTHHAPPTLTRGNSSTSLPPLPPAARSVHRA